jgi:hypothetical protein
MQRCYIYVHRDVSCASAYSNFDWFSLIMEHRWHQVWHREREERRGAEPSVAVTTRQSESSVAC